MSSHDHELHLAFFPFMAHGHMIPTIDLAKLFASRGHKATLITTPNNADFFAKSIYKSQQLGHQISLISVKFPSAEVGLPEGFESLSLGSSPDLYQKFLKAIPLLEKPLDELLQKHRPHVLVADTLFSWATDLAAKYGIPRLIFHGTCNFCVCASLCLSMYKPYKKVSSDSEDFVLPNLPNEIKFSRNQIPSFIMQEGETEVSKVFRASVESIYRSYGTVFNSFYELEGAYTDYYRNVLGRKCWNIGPVSLTNMDPEEKAYRGEASTVDHGCLKWLDTKKPNSVVYVCFGSKQKFTNEQLKEIALGLQASGQQFIWVVKKDKKDEGNGTWLPEGFEKRNEGKGLVVRGWAPQLLILSHEAVGGFVTHCGWNSILEAVSAGVPMVTWPMVADQFFNQKLVTQVLMIGIEVGIQWVGDSAKKDAIKMAVTQITAGEEAEELRNRARALAETAKRAFAEGGSSFNDLNSLLEELASLTNDKSLFP
ncbi:hypothetical protein L6164_032035 [Bauhinia variegata]|uniref:Uncharacterized protein n=1 Tax=Bauhinia variegata TaxID=167791 RepID=A0ACB9KN58_BAUVA|nr:hypothetical protein L6164_032035 [Bauhinia variegata]